MRSASFCWKIKSNKVELIITFISSHLDTNVQPLTWWWWWRSLKETLKSYAFFRWKIFFFFLQVGIIGIRERHGGWASFNYIIPHEHSGSLLEKWWIPSYCVFLLIFSPFTCQFSSCREGNLIKSWMHCTALEFSSLLCARVKKEVAEVSFFS